MKSTIIITEDGISTTDILGGRIRQYSSSWRIPRTAYALEDESSCESTVSMESRVVCGMLLGRDGLSEASGGGGSRGLARELW